MAATCVLDLLCQVIRAPSTSTTRSGPPPPPAPCSWTGSARLLLVSVVEFGCGGVGRRGPRALRRWIVMRRRTTVSRPLLEAVVAGGVGVIGLVVRYVAVAAISLMVPSWSARRAASLPLPVSFLVVKVVYWSAASPQLGRVCTTITSDAVKGVVPNDLLRGCTMLQRATTCGARQSGSPSRGERGTPMEFMRKMLTVSRLPPRVLPMPKIWSIVHGGLAIKRH